MRRIANFFAALLIAASAVGEDWFLPEWLRSEPSKRTGPIVDAADATARAVAWVNGYADFRNKKQVAVYERGWWSWRGRAGQGNGDVEVQILFHPNGTNTAIRVEHTGI